MCHYSDKLDRIVEFVSEIPNLKSKVLCLLYLKLFFISVTVLARGYFISFVKMSQAKYWPIINCWSVDVRDSYKSGESKNFEVSSNLPAPYWIINRLK